MPDHRMTIHRISICGIPIRRMSIRRVPIRRRPIRRMPIRRMPIRRLSIRWIRSNKWELFLIYSLFNIYLIRNKKWNVVSILYSFFLHQMDSIPYSFPQNKEYGTKYGFCSIFLIPYFIELILFLICSEYGKKNRKHLCSLFIILQNCWRASTEQRGVVHLSTETAAVCNYMYTCSSF